LIENSLKEFTKKSSGLKILEERIGCSRKKINDIFLENHQKKRKRWNDNKELETFMIQKYFLENNQDKRRNHLANISDSWYFA